MLTERQLFVLQILIDDYIRSAEPVGSRTISKRSDVSYSPATIRNELLDLEEMGFLEKPHSSSGRIPSEKGYRFYVDHLLSPELLSHPEIDNIQNSLAGKIVRLEDFAHETAQILSDFSHYTAVVLGPEMFDEKLKYVQMIPLTRDTAVTIIVTDTGRVDNQVVFIPKGVERSDIEKFINILNKKLSGSLIIDLERKISQEIAGIVKENIGKYEEMMAIIRNTFSDGNSEKLYFAGKTNILAQPEFHDIQKVRSLFDVIEEEEMLYSLLRSGTTGVQIKIGHENQLQAIADCSVVTADYSISDQHVGVIAVIGPTRMEYRRVIGLLELVSRDLSRVLTRRYQSK